VIDGALTRGVQLQRAFEGVSVRSLFTVELFRNVEELQLACLTPCMTETASASSVTAPSATAESSRRPNPSIVVLTTVTGFVWLLAFMLWIALAQVTDYTTYDLDNAAALETWIQILIVSGVVAAVGATAIVGVRHELRSNYWR
jgi:multisubunit Na+/H+ antiporter MnhC subunit